MLVLKCDRCSRIYDLESYTDTEFNSVAKVYKYIKTEDVNNQNYFIKDKYDLCKDCCNKFIAFLNNTSVEPTIIDENIEK